MLTRISAVAPRRLSRWQALNDQANLTWHRELQFVVFPGARSVNISLAVDKEQISRCNTFDFEIFSDEDWFELFETTMKLLTAFSINAIAASLIRSYIYQNN